MLAQRRGGERLRVCELCEMLGVSLRKLQDAFNEVFGVPPWRYIRTMRLSKARVLLSRADQSATVREIAISLGFAHLGHFGAYYKKAFGETPLQTLRRSRWSLDRGGDPGSTLLPEVRR
jgi:transcriptional regulator GlxA family with amidase domain